ncbi:hypothetical protein KWI07_00765 [Enterobacter bugandensis]|uniref:hypothetical protein n=1 Tax=Enterobacter bugandensis TaxID=881260 RepID=UPI0021D0DE04|nr:hypothetical protein [Enterobacter bugandensis]MCU6158944.1 hypothetical protein [Enterobacter bugandensis]
MKMKKVVKLLSNLGLDVAFSKRWLAETGQITVKLAALAAFSWRLYNTMFCWAGNQKHNRQVQPDDFWMFLVISEKW